MEENLIREAIKDFWDKRDEKSGTQAAAHDKAILELIVKDLIKQGWKEKDIFIPRTAQDKNGLVPGYYRAAKSWDIICRTNGKPKICIEFKSQVGSYGNNENNRYEEAMGSAIDLRAKYGEEIALGFIYVICHEDKSTSITKDRIDDIDEAFKTSSHIERRQVFAERICTRINGVKLYDSSAILMVKKNGEFYHPDNESISIEGFVERLCNTNPGNPINNYGDKTID